MNPIDTLARKLDRTWPNLLQAKEKSLAEQTRLTARLAEHVPNDASMVVFGSLARGEFTAGSDLDWTLLVDGRAADAHYVGAQTIARVLKGEDVKKPGPTGVFGNFAFSHPIVHQIGGQDDTNKNTTQRILLLLESCAIGQGDVHERVLRLVLKRYMDDDRGILYGSRRQTIPMFLLNDIVRYWRTVTVDFVYKQRERASGWPLRNVKLRMSRKLIFASGLLSCFGFELFAGTKKLRSDAGKVIVENLVDFLWERVRLTPLDHLAEAIITLGVKDETALLIFDAYNQFIGLLQDKATRDHLENLPLDDALGADPTFKVARDVAQQFQLGLNQLFFKENDRLTELTQQYGVF